MVASTSKNRLSGGPEACLPSLFFTALFGGRSVGLRADCKDTQDLITLSPQTLNEGELKQGRLLLHSLKRDNSFRE